MFKLHKIEADLLLIHAPAYFDFRKEDKIYFPYLSTSGDVPITPVYEYFPLGFKTLQKYLGERGHVVKILNLCSVMLMYPDIDVNILLKNISSKVIGISFHWMVHVQGALKLASIIKSLYPEVPILFGGISSSYYGDELIKYNFVDMVMRGYDTHYPMDCLINKIKQGNNLKDVPNLIWKNKNNEIIDNKITYLPNKFSEGIDWSKIRQDRKSFIPINEIITTQSAGCCNNCGWCGGSSSAFKRLYKCDKSIVLKSSEDISYEFESMLNINNIEKFNCYTCGAYNESKERFNNLLEKVKECEFKSIDFEQYSLTEDQTLKRMVDANKRTIITLSPESHDIEISKLSGRGVYSMKEMEEWIKKAFDIGIFEVDIWFFVGMPQQDSKSVIDTVKYCEKLLKTFKGNRVMPFICPMIPFLDPASLFFENPQKYGYNVYFKTLEEHSKGMTKASIINRINYSTKWLGREELVNVSYDAIRGLFELKGEHGLLPSTIVESTIKKIDDAKAFIKIVHEIDCIEDERIREIELNGISKEILKRNKEVFFKGVSNQAFPLSRAIGDRWIDEILWDKEILDQL